MPNDLAGGSTYTPNAIEQLHAGDDPIKTGSAVALADLAKYALAALTSTGLAAFNSASHTAAQAVLVMQPVLNGQMAQYAWKITVNDAAITWPAQAAIDTYAERLAFFNGNFRVAKLGGGWSPPA